MDRQLLQPNISSNKSNKESDISGFFIIVILIYFIIHSTDIYDLDKDNFFKTPLFMIILGTILLFSTIGSIIYYYKKTSNGLLFWFLISIIIIITGVIYKSFKAEDIIEEDGEDIYKNFKEQNQLSTLIPLILFTISGIISYMVISKNNNCNGAMCSKLYIATFTILMYGIYYIINIFKQFSNVGFINEDKNNKNKNKKGKKNKDIYINKSYNLIAIIILCIWQFYILMISDVFRFSNIHKRQYRGVISDLHSKDSLKYLIYMSFVYIIFSFIVNTIGTVNCEKWKNIDKVNNIKEIQANIIVSAVITLILINTV
jgi:hypothetical protein